MRYPASEKLEIIRTVETSHLSAKQTLTMLGIPSSTFYRWYALYLDGAVDTCLSPLKLCQYLIVTGGRRDGPETFFG